MLLRMVFALIVGWFCYFWGYGCIIVVILKVYWDTSDLLFSSFLDYGQLLFWKESRERGISEDGKACDNEQGNSFSCFFFWRNKSCAWTISVWLQQKVSASPCILCVSSWVSVSSVPRIYAPGIALCECHVVLTVREKHQWEKHSPLLASRIV